MIAMIRRRIIPRSRGMGSPRVPAPPLAVEPATAGDAPRRLDLTAEIRQRAWDRYVRRGGRDGYDLDDWLEAERELLDGPRLAALAARDDHPPRP